MNPTLPTADDAYATLQERVYQKIFFAKSAAAGHSPKTAQEAALMLEIAGKLRMAGQIERTKVAADGVLDRMNAHLNRHLQANGVNLLTQQAEASFKTAAVTLASDPVLYNSVLSLKQAEAVEIRKALAG